MTSRFASRGHSLMASCLSPVTAYTPPCPRLCAGFTRTAVEGLHILFTSVGCGRRCATLIPQQRGQLQPRRDRILGRHQFRKFVISYAFSEFVIFLLVSTLLSSSALSPAMVSSGSRQTRVALHQTGVLTGKRCVNLYRSCDGRVGHRHIAGNVSRPDACVPPPCPFELWASLRYHVQVVTGSLMPPITQRSTLVAVRSLGVCSIRMAHDIYHNFHDSGRLTGIVMYHGAAVSNTAPS